MGLRRIRRVPAYVRDLLAFDPREQARHDYEDVFLTSQRDLASLAPEPLGRCRLLVLGCGYHYPDVVLYAPVVQRVVGADVLKVYYRDVLAAALVDAARGKRPVASLLEAAVRWRQYGRYYRHLQPISGVAADHAGYSLISYDGRQMPFDDEAFDIVMSNAVLEHVSDLPALVQELGRITRPGGISYHLWHNYYSYSGSHLPERLRLEAPWGHLRGIHRTRGLNRLAPEDVRGIFAQAFRVVALYGVDARHRKRGVHEGFEFEREDLLTPEIRQELKDLSRDLLLTRAYLIVARKGS